MRISRCLASAAVVLVCCVFLSCTAVRDAVTERIMRPPSVRIVSAEITDLSFTGARVLFDVKITNPNSLGFTLDGFQYDLLIEDESFLRGRQDGRVVIEAGGSSTVPLPLAFEYAAVYRALEHLIQNDGASYVLEMTCFFDLPVLGRVEVPARAEGTVPLLKPPDLSLRSVRVTRVGLTSADFVIEAALDNPNPFAFEVSLFRYELLVNRKTWAEGQAHGLDIREKQVALLSFPVTVNYSEVSESLYGLLATGKKTIAVLKGSVDILTPLPLLGEVSLPFEIEGEIPLIR